MERFARHALALLLPLAIAAATAGCGAVEDPSDNQTFNEESASTACSSASVCTHPNVCALCTPDRGPACASSQCYQGFCDVIEPCSGVRCASAADCPHSNVCALCSPGRGPSCATSQCLNGYCHEIGACSLSR